MTIEFLEDYFRERFCSVEVGIKNSMWVRLLRGVPQGSALGPLAFLFSVKLDEIPELRDYYSQFADDVKRDKVAPAYRHVDIKTWNWAKISDKMTLHFVSRLWQNFNRQQFPTCLKLPSPNDHADPLLVNPKGVRLTDTQNVKRGGFQERAVAFWNPLPLKLRAATSLDSFRTEF
jgi:hypothetical protein